MNSVNTTKIAAFAATLVVNLVLAVAVFSLFGDNTVNSEVKVAHSEKITVTAARA